MFPNEKIFTRGGRLQKTTRALFETREDIIRLLEKNKNS